MKTTALCLAISALLLALPSARADGFRGLYIGAKIGENSSRFSGTAVVNNSTEAHVTLSERVVPTAGLEIGYNAASGDIIVGFDGIVDFNARGGHPVRVSGSPGYLETRYGSTVYAADIKLGIASGYWMPYVKLGYGNVRADGGLSGEGSGGHFALGAEFSIAPRTSMAAELSDIEVNSDGGTLHNTNFTISVNFFLE